MLNFVLCEDNSAILNKLSKMLESLFIKHNFDAEIVYSSANPKNVYQYVKDNIVDVLFLDIDLKSNISGLDLASQIRKINNHAYIVFTSAHLEYILMAYKYKTFDFIPKPITIERLEDTILRIIEDVNSNDYKSKFIHLNNKNAIFHQDSINFIKKDGMKLVFYTDKKVYETYSSFSKIAEELPPNFVRCHKSYIANVNKIYDISPKDNSIFFEGDSEAKCYIGPKYKNKLMEVFNNGNFTKNME